MIIYESNKQADNLHYKEIYCNDLLNWQVPLKYICKKAKVVRNFKLKCYELLLRTINPK